MTQCTFIPETACIEEIRRTRLLASPTAWIRLQYRRYRTRRQLAQLPDYMLRDLGLTRFDVQREVTRPFWR